MSLQPAWRWRALLSRFVIALAIVTVATASSVGYAYWFANDQFNRATKVELPAHVLRDTGKPTDPANYLIVGSDSRAFVHDQVAADHFGTTRTNPENLADVIMIAHVDPNAPGKGFLVSIPRDTWVAIPGHGNQKINAAYNYGKTPAEHVALLVQTIAQNFHVHIDHYMKVDFATFAGVVDAIGHVPIFFPAAAYDTETGLRITTPGCKELDGLDALAYARSRTYHYKTATGYKLQQAIPDLARIKRQQYFIRSLAKEAIKKSAHNPFTARRIVEKIVPKLEVDSHLQFSDFLNLVRAFRSVDPGAVQMVTVPTESAVITNGSHHTDIQRLKAAEAKPIFDLLEGFTRTPVKTASVKPASVKVQVLNGSGVKGIAATTAHALEAAGFANGGMPGDADNHAHDLTLVRYSGNNLAKANAVAAYLGGVGLVTRSATPLGTADVVVVTGADLAAVVAPGSHPSSSTPRSAPATSTPTVTTAFPNPGTTPGVTVPNFGGRPPVGCG